jgi:hypothetical protein
MFAVFSLPFFFLGLLPSLVRLRANNLMASYEESKISKERKFFFG